MNFYCTLKNDISLGHEALIIDKKIIDKILFYTGKYILENNFSRLNSKKALQYK